jgi:hypothetical protein
MLEATPLLPPTSSWHGAQLSTGMTLPLPYRKPEVPRKGLGAKQSYEGCTVTNEIEDSVLLIEYASRSPDLSSCFLQLLWTSYATLPLNKL